MREGELLWLPGAGSTCREQNLDSWGMEVVVQGLEDPCEDSSAAQ